MSLAYLDVLAVHFQNMRQCIRTPDQEVKLSGLQMTHDSDQPSVKTLSLGITMMPSRT